jgi:hypothetical protein
MITSSFNSASSPFTKSLFTAKISCCMHWLWTAF